MLLRTANKYDIFILLRKVITVNCRLLGERIKQRRTELDMTQGDIASQIGVAISTVQRYEKGQIEKIKLPVVEAIAGALEVDLEWLIGKTDVMVKSNPQKRGGLRLKRRVQERIPDYSASLNGLHIDSWTYGALVLFARQNHRLLQEEIEERLYWSVENEIEDMVSAEDNARIQEQLYSKENKD